MEELGELVQLGSFQVFRRGPVGDEAARRVLLLPGGFCTALSYIDVVREQVLADAKITTYAANPPGFRDNPPPPGFTHSTTEYAELIEQLAHTEQIDLLVGHSLSANILIELAARGEYDGPIILLGPCLRQRNEYRGVRLLRRLEFFEPLARRAYASTSRNFRRTMAGLVRPERLELIVGDMELTPSEQNRAVINGYFDQLEEHGTLAKLLARAGGEIHFVRGDAESIGFDRADRQSVVAQQNVTTHTITGSDHMMMLDNPAEVAALIAAVAAS
jgi:pimeloyl-ACP methyl ester carboxylesterase